MSTKLLYSKSKTYCDLFPERLAHMFLHVLNQYLLSLHNVLARSWIRRVQEKTGQTPGSPSGELLTNGFKAHRKTRTVHTWLIVISPIHSHLEFLRRWIKDLWTHSTNTVLKRLMSRFLKETIVETSRNPGKILMF